MLGGFIYDLFPPAYLIVKKTIVSSKLWTVPLTIWYTIYRGKDEKQR